MEEQVKETEEAKEKTMHELAMVCGWRVAGLALFPLATTELSNLYAIPILSASLSLFMFSKLVGVLEQIRDTLRGN